MTSAVPCFVVTSEDGELLRTVCRTDAPRQQLNFKHLCKLSAYLTQLCDYDYPEIALQGATIVASKASQFITMAVLLQPSPDTSAARLELQEFTACLAQVIDVHQQMPFNDICMHTDVTQRTVRCSQTSLTSTQLLDILAELDRQQCLLHHLQPSSTADGVTHVHLIELHPLKGLITLRPAAASHDSQSIYALSAELQEGLLVACQLLSHYQSLQHSQGRKRQAPAALVAQARRPTLATVKSQCTQCSLKALNTLNGSLFLIAFCSVKLLPQAFTPVLHTAQRTQSANRTSESVQLLLGKAAVPVSVQSFLKSSYGGIKNVLTVT